MSKTLTPLSLIISLLMHLAFLIMILLSGSGGGGGKTGTHGEKGKGTQSSGTKYKGVDAEDVIPKEKLVEVSIVSPPSNPKGAVIHKPKPAMHKKTIKDCPGKWYGGIGISDSFNLQTGVERVDTVFYGYPADLAGIKVGDLIMSISDREIVGTPGTYITLHILRGKDILDFTIQRDRICY